MGLVQVQGIADDIPLSEAPTALVGSRAKATFTYQGRKAADRLLQQGRPAVAATG